MPDMDDLIEACLFKLVRLLWRKYALARLARRLCILSRAELPIGRLPRVLDRYLCDDAPDVIRAMR